MLLGMPFVGTEGDLVARMASAMGLAQEHVSYAYLNPCAHDEAPVDEMARHWLPFFKNSVPLRSRRQSSPLAKRSFDS